MTESVKANLDSLLGKSKQFFNPDFFGLYSFEYAYRLLLVYLSSNKSKIREIRAGDPSAFEHAFEGDMKEAIEFTAKLRGVNIDTKLLESLLYAANDSALLFLKSSMSTSPSKVAKSVAEAMDKQVADALGDGKRIVVQKVFSEEHNA